VTVRVEVEDGKAERVEVGVRVRVCVLEGEALVVDVLDGVDDEELVLVPVLVRVLDMDGAKPAAIARSRDIRP